MNLLHREAELAEAQRALQSHRELVNVCTDNMRYLGQMIEERDQAIQKKDRVIAILSDEVRYQKLQRLQEGLKEEGEEDSTGRPPISPLILPAPAPAPSIPSSPLSFLSSSSSSSFSPLLLRHRRRRHPTHGLTTTRAAARRRRNRATTSNSPIEAPRTAERNGPSSHRSKRARHNNNGVRQGHDGPSSLSPSSSSSEETVYPASDVSWELTAEERADQEWMERLRRAVERCFLPIPDGF